MTMSAYGLPVLICAWVGYVLPYLLSLTLDMHTSETLVRSQAIFCAFKESAMGLPFSQGAIVLGVQTFTQGIITALALYRTRGRSMRTVASTTLICLPMLVLGNGVYGVLMSIAAAGLTLPLSALHLDPAQLWAGLTPAHPLDVIGREVAAQAVNALLKYPGEPFCSLAQSIRAASFEWKTMYTHLYSSSLVYNYIDPSTSKHVNTLGFWSITISSALLMITVESLLRFRMMIVLEHTISLRNHAAHLTDLGLRGSATFACRHLSDVILHMWLVRIATISIQVMFLVVPTVLAERIITPRIGQMIGATWIYPICVWLITVSTAWVNSVFTAFALIYDGRLFLALRHAYPVNLQQRLR